MYTVDTALESLKKYDIRESDLLAWERALDLDISVDEYGRKQYSPHHINLFKNIKKHLALGRTIDEIRQIIDLPPLVKSHPQPKPAAAPINQQAARPQPAMAAANAAPRSQQPAAVPHSASTPDYTTSAYQPSAPTAPQGSPMAGGRTMPPQGPAISNIPGPEPITSSIGPDKSAYASAPKRPQVRQAQPSGAGAANVVNLVQRLTQEKDDLYKKLLETEKLNSHLYSANSLFNKKVREMAQQITHLRENMEENERFKLMDDKARLHKQLIDIERVSLLRQDEIQTRTQEIDNLNHQIRQLEQKIQALESAFNPEKFRGDWMESGQLVEVIYDNFGINIEPERVRLFRISQLPARRYGAMAIINTSYQYETNSLWKRDETLTVAYLDENTLDGELIAEYILDGVPVAKALYRVTCRRNP